MLHRALVEWGYACAVIAPSLIPKRSDVHRKHDKRDASDLARLYRAGELVAVRIPSEADELDISPVISTPEFTCKRVDKASEASSPKIA